jgi:tellurite methyltransferase
MGRSVEFFESQFRRQVAAGEFALNPFELRALDHLVGSVLDLGCGLGNLSLEAARRGHDVVAIDASPTACQALRASALREGLAVEVLETDLETWITPNHYATVVSIGLLMFFPRERALALLRSIQESVEPGGRAIVNVLIEGTTYMEMFEPGAYTLFGHDELEQRFAGWKILSCAEDTFPAAGETQKVFSTLIAEKPLLGTGIKTANEYRF